MGTLRDTFLVTPSYQYHEILAVAETITYEDICGIAKSNALFQDLSVDALIQGNITEKEAENVLTLIDKTLLEGINTNSDSTQSLKPMKVVDLRDGDKLVRIRARQLAKNPEEINNISSILIEVNSIIKHCNGSCAEIIFDR